MTYEIPRRRIDCIRSRNWSGAPRWSLRPRRLRAAPESQSVV